MILAEIKKGWEHRFPALSGKWTHWKITGDGALLGIVEWNNLSRALDVVEQNYGRFSSIKAHRVTVDEESNVREEEHFDSEISCFWKDEQIRNTDRKPDI